MKKLNTLKAKNKQKNIPLVLHVLSTPDKLKSSGLFHSLGKVNTDMRVSVGNPPPR